MQGINPSEAFSSLPRSMQGMDEVDDSVSGVLSSENRWSLEREQVRLEHRANQNGHIQHH